MNGSLSASSMFLVAEITVLVLAVILVFMILSVRKNTSLLEQINQRSLQKDESEKQELFNGEQAEKWFEKGDLKELHQYCEGFLKKSPNSVHANWYHALSYYNQGNYVMARQYFENVIHINPLWREGAVIYLQEIAEKIGFPNNHVMH